MTKIYHYSALNGEYMGEGVADPNPLEPGAFLFPANSTQIAPPVIDQAESAAQFRGDAWAIVADLRGTRYWLGTVEYTITEIDTFVPEGATRVEPPKDPDVIDSADVNKERDRRILDGVVVVLVEAEYDTDGNEITAEIAVHLGGDETTKINLLGLAQAATLRLGAGDATHITRYRDEGDVIHALLPAQVIQLWSGGADYVEAVMQAAWAIKDDPDGISEDFANDPRWPEQRLPE